MEEEVQRLRDEKSEVENQSMIIFAENEERLQMVHEQESVITQFRSTCYEGRFFVLAYCIRYNCFISSSSHEVMVFYFSFVLTNCFIL